MAVFEKTKGQSALGWDQASHMQTIQEGKESLISLGGYDLGTFYIISTNPSVCTVHERTAPDAPRPLMQRDFLLTGVKDGECELRAMYSDTSQTVLASIKIVVTNQKMAAKLVFFPGERRLGDCTMGTIFVVGGNGERYDAVGGSPKAYKDKGGHRSDPTPKGVYVLGAQHKATTGTWPNSCIPFGAKLRLGTEPHRVQYQIAGDQWADVNGPKGYVTKFKKEFALKDGVRKTTEQCDKELNAELFTDSTWTKLKFDTWMLNDFGRWSWNMTQNNKNTEFYIHTTSPNEIETVRGVATVPFNSHGCIHIMPKTRDQMIADGYLKKGMILEVRGYEDVAPIYYADKPKKK